MNRKDVFRNILLLRESNSHQDVLNPRKELIT